MTEASIWDLSEAKVQRRVTKEQLQAFGVEAFAVGRREALAADGVKVSFGAVTGMLVKTVSRIKFF